MGDVNWIQIVSEAKLLPECDWRHIPENRFPRGAETTAALPKMARNSDNLRL
jgi:hypothetical protein